MSLKLSNETELIKQRLLTVELIGKYFLKLGKTYVQQIRSKTCDDELSEKLKRLIIETRNILRKYDNLKLKLFRKNVKGGIVFKLSKEETKYYFYQKKLSLAKKAMQSIESVIETIRTIRDKSKWVIRTKSNVQTLVKTKTCLYELKTSLKYLEQVRTFKVVISSY